LIYDARMKMLLLRICALFALGVLPLLTRGQDSQYVQVYGVIQEADQSLRNGQQDSARAKYLEAQEALKRIQTAFPAWNANVVRFRLDYVAGRIEELGPPPVSSQEKREVLPKPVPSTPEEARIAEGNEEIARLKSENAVLQSKLKEALAARPAALNPQELARAQEKILALEKEKELLRLALEKSTESKDAPGGNGEISAALAEANRKIAQQAEMIVALQREKEILETRLHAMQQESASVPVIPIESQEVKDQRAPSAVPVGQTQGGIQGDTGNLKETDVAKLQAALQELRQEKASLERVKADLESQLASESADPASQLNRVRKIETERDELLKKLNETTRQLYDNKARTEIVEKEEEASQLEILRARLEVFEARKIPFTPEELALFKKPDAILPPASGGAGRSLELPRGGDVLASEGERAFAAGRLDEAAEKFQEILRLDSKNVYGLVSLGTVELLRNRLTESEASLNRALGFAPGDPVALRVLGSVRYEQNRFDEALDLLSRSAQADPNDPETQNYLGITLSQMGQRAAAETALRRAVQLAPTYGRAHHNLALIYATQEPPFKELARWHYQKALATGHAPNPALEALIERGSGGVKAE
jgi:tetratricopeptide (TPR) repeat protein